MLKTHPIKKLSVLGQEHACETANRLQAYDLSLYRALFFKIAALFSFA